MLHHLLFVGAIVLGCFLGMLLIDLIILGAFHLIKSTKNRRKEDEEDEWFKELIKEMQADNAYREFKEASRDEEFRELLLNKVNVCPQERTVN